MKTATKGRILGSTQSASIRKRFKIVASLLSGKRDNAGSIADETRGGGLLVPKYTVYDDGLQLLFPADQEASASMRRPMLPSRETAFPHMQEPSRL